MVGPAILASQPASLRITFGCWRWTCSPLPTHRYNSPNSLNKALRTLSLCRYHPLSHPSFSLMRRQSRSHSSTTSSSDDDMPILKSARGGLDEPEEDKTTQQLFQSRVDLLCRDSRIQSFSKMDDVVQALQDFCKNSGLSCVVRIRSSDKSRATLSCKNQARGCQLRLTLKKHKLQNLYNITINPSSLVFGSCIAGKCGDLFPGVLSPPVLPPAPGIPGVPPAPGIPGAAAGNSSSTLPQAPGSLHPGRGPGTVPQPPGIPGTAAQPALPQCVECRDPASLCCSSGVHFWCAECMDSLALNQLQSWESFVKRGCQYMCIYQHELQQSCEINSQSILSSLKPDTFKKHVAALTEQARQQAILDTQTKLAQQEPVKPPSPHELAMKFIQRLAVPRCPKCDVPILDFEACSALTCGQKALVGGYEGGCGAKLCAWCLCEISDDQSHHQHVAQCKYNPAPGEVHPPQPHPQVWLSCYSVRAREKVFVHIEKQTGSEARDALYAEVQKEYPMFGLDADWLASRHEWLLLQLQNDLLDVDITTAETTLSLLKEMGYPDSQILRRAVLFCEGRVVDVINAMRAIQ